ncbi:MAG: DEAD/DEAH box helicase family protein [Spirochaetes bacterium]|jgi:DNA excision repair protein ERCC-3|nr:DEAD/DEAH box helicase family protein [Spirochaetota bacterium]
MAGQPVIVQGDSTLLVDVHDPGFEAARNAIGAFAELEKSPEHIHTYRMSPLSLWNAASAGWSADDVIGVLDTYSRYPVPDHIGENVRDLISRFGKLVLRAYDRDGEAPVGERGDGGRTPRTDAASTELFLDVEEESIRAELAANKRVQGMLRTAEMDERSGFIVSLYDRGTLKQELTRIGYPVKDEAPLTEGDYLEVKLGERTTDGGPFTVRDYQREAAGAFYGDGRPGTGFGTVVMPCGAGKTIVGMKVMELAATQTLILTTNVAATHQWIDELIDKTELSRELVGEYTGGKKEIKPVTIATYQIIVWRPDRNEDFPHFELFRARNWGLIIYDEVHLLPAPVFRVTAEIQALRRLGLTATLVREDGRESDVFSLVGPKRYDVPWKELEQKGWIAEAVCYELRVELPPGDKIPYATADRRGKFRIASENERKIDITRQLVENHREDAIMVIGQYLDQLKRIAKDLDAPIITGKTPNAKREEIYAAFRRGDQRIIVVSKVANFAIDLPDASVAIQVSGTFGSRQEEAQRLGRILRPKERNSFFYTLVSRFTTEEQFAANRQKFLTEQGYKYHIEIWE